MNYLEKKIQEILRQYYYDHHDKHQMQANLVSALEDERVAMLDKIASRITERLEVLRNPKVGVGQGLSGECVHKLIRESAITELKNMKDYLTRLKLTKSESSSPPSDEL